MAKNRKKRKPQGNPQAVKPVKKKKNKQKKYLLIALAVLVVLGAVLAVLLLTNNKADTTAADTASSEEEEDTTLEDREESEITVITVHNAEDTFSFYKGTKTADDGTEESAWLIQGYEDQDVDSDTLANAAEMFYSLSYTKKIGEVEDPTEFGIDKSSYAGAVYTDGTGLTIYFGDVPPETSGRYVMIHDTVYIISVNTAYLGTANDLINGASWTIDELVAEPEETEESSEEESTETTESSEEASDASDSTADAASEEESEDSSEEEPETYSILGSFHLSGTNFPQEIDLSCDVQTGVYMLNSPVKCEANEDKVEELIDDLLSVSCNSTVTLDATDEELAAYGLDDPYCVLEFTLNNVTKKMTVGAEDDSSKRYCTIDDGKAVYLISESKISDWADSTPMDYRSDVLNSDSFDDICEADFTVDGYNYNIVNTREVDENSSTDTVTYYTYDSTCDGEASVYNDCSWLYTRLANAAVLNMDEETPDGDPFITLKLSYWDGTADKTIEVYKASVSTQYIVYVDGNYSCTIRNTALDDFYTKLEDFAFYVDKEDDSSSSEASETEESAESSETSETSDETEESSETSDAE